MAHTFSRRRTAAATALLAMAGIVLGLALLVVRNPLPVAGALAALAAAGYAAWIAITRPGTTRLVAAAAAAGALVAAVALLVAAGAFGELFIVAVSFLVFAGVAPFALRRDAPEPSELRRQATTPSQERRVLIVNPRSGDGVAGRTGLAEEAERRRIEVVLLEPGDDLLALAVAAAQTADVIGMAGGDGSQALVAGVASDHNLPFVCVPAGTRNHFAADLGIDRRDVVDALDAFGWGTERRVDLARVNDRVFVNNVSLGIYAEVVQSDGYREAKLATAGSMLPELLGPNADALAVRLSQPDGRSIEAARIVMVSNNPYHLTGVAGIGARPRLDTGRLGVLALEINDASDMAALVSLDAVGQARRFPGWHEWSTDSLVIDADGQLPAGIDGESLQLDPPLQFAIAPGALRVRIVPWAGESGASSRTVSRAVLGSLWKVASGSS